MAPNTRAVSKRAQGLAKVKLLANDPNQKVSASAVAKDVRCHLLELPPELRNRIYELANEESCSPLHRSPYVPRAQKMLSESSFTVPWQQRVWQFFGLTQSCKQLRSEYRPLWIRDLTVRLKTGIFSEFVATFLPTSKDESLLGPKLIQISWDHGLDNILEKDLTPFLLLRGRLPDICFDFVPYRLADLKMEPGEEPCEFCCERMHLEEHGHDPEDADGYCSCYDSDMDYEEWVMLEEDQMEYTDILKDFLSNNNEKWMADILAENINVKCSFDCESDLPTFRIFCKKPLKMAASDLAHAYDLLKSWGIFDLRSKALMEFFIAWKGKSKGRIGQYHMTKTVVRQVHVPRPVGSRDISSDM